MSNLSLDIDYKNIVEWLSQRNKLNKEWPRKLKAAKLKLQQLLEKNNYQSIESEEIKQQIEQNIENFNYQHIEYVLNKLIETPQGQQKTLFGGYSNKTVKDWNALNKFYRQNNLHIVDLAKIISQNVSFEIPALNKSIKNSVQSVETSEQKIQDSKNTIKQLEQDYIKHCSKLGIEGKNLSQEVPQMVKQLPNFYDKIVQKIQNEEIKQSLEYYYKFTQYVNPKQNMDSIKLKLIEYIHKFGDDTLELYELRKNNQEVEVTDENVLKNNNNKYKFYEHFGKQEKKPEGIDWSAFSITSTGGQGNQQQQENQTTEINWGISLDQPKQENTESSGINWGITVEPQPESKQETVQEIKWDITTETNNIDTIENKPQENQVTEINWNIETVEQSNNNQQNEQKEEEQFETEIFTLISCIDTRNLLIQELSELNAFYLQRSNESDSHSTNSLLQMYDTNEEGSENVFEIDAQNLKRYMHITREILKNLKDYQFRQLLIIKEQPKSQERIIKNLEQYNQNIQKQQNNIQQLQKKIKSSEDTKTQNQQILKKISNLTVDLKKITEENLTETVKNPVKIIGDINKIKKQ